MGKYLDEMKLMTVDPACHRLGEIADELSARLDDIEKRGKRYLDDVDNGKLISPACKRTDKDAGCDQAAIADHTRLEAFRYLLVVPRREFMLLADPVISFSK